MYEKLRLLLEQQIAGVLPKIVEDGETDGEEEEEESREGTPPDDQNPLDDQEGEQSPQQQQQSAEKEAKPTDQPSENSQPQEDE